MPQVRRRAAPRRGADPLGRRVDRAAAERYRNNFETAIAACQRGKNHRNRSSSRAEFRSRPQVHLHERDCSVQRRFQKVIEIAPSVGLPDECRLALHDDAVRLTAAAGYRCAGTVEFLVDPQTWKRSSRAELSRRRRGHDASRSRQDEPTQALLHRGEPADPGRAHGDRGRHGRGPRPGADPRHGRRDARGRRHRKPGRHHATGLRDPVARDDGRPRGGLPARRPSGWIASLP